MKWIRRMTLALALSAGWTTMTPSEASAGYGPLVLRANEDTFVRFLLLNQVWARFIEQNPGTAVQGKEENSSLDLGVRRTRFVAFGKLGKETLLLLHLGMNNQTFRNNAFQGSAPMFFVHEALVEYSLIDEDALHVAVGGGLSSWNGISRLTSASAVNMLTVDLPVVNFPTVNGPDQLGRFLGIYAKGDAAGGLLDFRFAASRPFEVGGGGFNPSANTWAAAGYVKLQLWEPESNVLSYAVGTYLGSKSVFNIGLGGFWQPDGGLDAPDESGDPVPSDILLLGADVFLDTPLGEDGAAGAITLYGALYQYDFGGGDLVRNIGVMNFADSTPLDGESFAANGRGNGYASIGEGTSLLLQLGYVLPFSIDEVRLQPYAATQLSFWDAYDGLTPMLEGGLNVLVDGHHSKITLHYRARPIVAIPDEGSPSFSRFASELILQGQVFL